MVIVQGSYLPSRVDNIGNRRLVAELLGLAWAPMASGCPSQRTFIREDFYCQFFKARYECILHENDMKETKEGNIRNTEKITRKPQLANSFLQDAFQ